MFVHWLILLLPLVPGAFFLLNQSALLPDALDLANTGSFLSRIYVPWVLPLWLLYALWMVIPLWSAAVRRLHSIPVSGWWLLIGLIPVVGWFILLILLFQKGDYEEYLHRLKRARGENSMFNAVEDTVTAAAKPRNGGWSFVMLLLLSAGGWFLNRQIMENGLQQTAATALEAVTHEKILSLLHPGESDAEGREPDRTALPAAGFAADGELSPISVVHTPDTEKEAAADPEPAETPEVSGSSQPQPVPELKAADSASEPGADPAGMESTLTAAEEKAEAEELLPSGLWAQEGIRAKDSARMVYIPGAVFTMGAANGAPDERPAHEVTLSGYWIDAFEINNEQYALCAAEGICSEPHERKSLRHPSYFGNPLYNNYPVIAVDRAQAQTYCEWAGGRLPTEAEWEYAAKGPEGNTYPWGTSFDAAKLNYSGNGDYDTMAVNATPEDISAFEIINLGGNVAEWVFDRYQENWYSLNSQPEDPTGPENGNYYVIRGGSAQTGENNVRTADRFFAQGTSFGLDRGFRCGVKEERKNEE